MSSESYDIRDRIVECAIEFRNNSKVSGEKIAKLQDKPKKLEEFMKENIEANQNLMNRFFSLVDEYIAIKGGE
jgi:hypothetical protein